MDAPEPSGPRADRLPDFLIVGAPRSATTALSAMLSALPDVFIPPEKELFFFSDRYDDGVAAYARHFASAGERRAGEATPTYLASDVAAARMAEVVPSARLVAVLRDPVARAWSHYWHRRIWGREQRTFAAAVEDEDAGRMPDLDGRYVEVGMYHHQLERLEQHFPRESVHVAFFDDVVRATPGTIDAICRFIGVNPSAVGPVGDRITRNASYAVRSYRLHLGLWRRDLYRRMPRPLALAIARANRLPIPPMDATTAAALRERFSIDQRALAARLGREPPWATASSTG